MEEVMELRYTQVFNSHELLVSCGKHKTVITAQIEIKIMFMEPKYTDYIKLSLFSDFKLFDSVFDTTETQFLAIILSTLKCIVFLF